MTTYEEVDTCPRQEVPLVTLAELGAFLNAHGLEAHGYFERGEYYFVLRKRDFPVLAAASDSLDESVALAVHEYRRRMQ
jgi:hypothetical protein